MLRLPRSPVPLLQYEYLWADGVKVKKPVRLTAPEYINTLCDWIESQARSPIPDAMPERFGDDT